jgi:hypothetical protein
VVSGSSRWLVVALTGLLACGGGGATADASDAAAADGSPGRDGAVADAPGAREDAALCEPEPIPVLDENALPPPCPGSTPEGYFQFLDDTCGRKVFPSHQDRDRPCPVVDTDPVIELAGGGTVTYQPSSAPISVDAEALVGLVPPELDIAVILIRRVGGVPHYRYLSNGSHDRAVQPWSTTKFLAAANAASMLRILSDYEVGLTASVDGVPLGDLVTSVHSYDDDPYSSNSLARYFHDIGGRQRAYDLIHDLWLDRPSGESFGGNYGAASPSLGYTFVDGAAQVTVEPDSATGFVNHLSMLTLAEGLRRLVLHREEPAERLPGIQWADVGTLLFGAEGSAKYGPWGGMTRNTAVYLQSGHDIDYLERRARGTWVVFSKLGLGSAGQFLDVGYACLPVLDEQDQPVPGWGRELVIAAHLPAGGATWAERDRLLALAYRAILIRVVDGRL